MTERLVADFLDWDEEELPPESKDEVLGRLFRGIANTEGAGWFFVQCSRQQGSEVVEQLKGRFGRVEVLELERGAESFYPEAMGLFETNPFDVLVVQGVDEALLGYEDTKRALGWDSADLHNYDSRDVPPLLSHFNQVRECLRDTVPRPVVFVVSAFVVKYLLLRAPDFYDWRAGTLTLPLDEGDRSQIMGWTKSAEYGDYCNLSERERQQKIADLHQLIETDSLEKAERSRLLVEEGLLFESGNTYEQAIFCYDKALEIEPDKDTAWFGKGFSLVEIGRYEEAIASYDKALEIKPDKDEAWYNRGSALDELERYEEAIASYDKALEIKPDNSWTRHQIGWAYLIAKQYEKSIETFQQCLDLNGDDPEGHYGLACVYSQKNQIEPALEWLAKVFKLDPDNYRERTAKDSDFDPIRSDPRFQDLIQPNE